MVKLWHTIYWDYEGEEYKCLSENPCPMYLSEDEVQKSYPATVDNTSLDDMINAVDGEIENMNYHHNPGINPLVGSILKTLNDEKLTKLIIFDYLSDVGIGLGLDR